MMILLFLELPYEVSKEANEYNLAPERCCCILAWFSFWFWNCKLTQDADEG